MNRENLKKIVDYIQTIPQEMFDIAYYRGGNDDTIECDSVGCVLGHSVILDPDPKSIPRYVSGNINFDRWSENFTGLPRLSREWSWCFASEWKYADSTILGAIKRINWLLDHGLPKNWNYQMSGEDELCYK